MNTVPVTIRTTELAPLSTPAPAAEPEQSVLAVYLLVLRRDSSLRLRAVNVEIERAA